jgi:nucleoside-triphosphatase THEP1
VVYLAKENVKNVLIIVPIGIPGMGKSTAFSRFDSLVDSTNVEIFKVSSDEIREE